MLNCTIALRRLFTKPPTEGELRYAWWYVRGGRGWWVEDLRHFSERDRNRVLYHADQRMAKRLETWDTLNYRTWKAGLELPRAVHPVPACPTTLLERK